MVEMSHWNIFEEALGQQIGRYDCVTNEMVSLELYFAAYDRSLKMRATLDASP